MGRGKRRHAPHYKTDGTPKIMYRSRTAAMRATLRLSDADLDNGTAFRRMPTVYRCEDGGHWHIGNVPTGRPR